MIILGLHLATAPFSLSLFSNGNSVSSLSFEGTHLNTEQLDVFLVQLLEKASLTFQDIQVLTFTNGPGSYTGLRIAATFMNTLSYVLSIPIYPVSTLQMYARAVGLNKRVLSVCKARLSEFNVGGFEGDLCFFDEQILSADALVDLQKQFSCPVVGQVLGLEGKILPECLVGLSLFSETICVYVNELVQREGVKSSLFSPVFPKYSQTPEFKKTSF